MPRYERVRRLPRSLRQSNLSCWSRLSKTGTPAERSRDAPASYGWTCVERLVCQSVCQRSGRRGAPTPVDDRRDREPGSEWNRLIPVDAPKAYSASLVRRKIRPSESAGVAKIASSSSFTAWTSQSFPARMTATLPSSFARNILPAATIGDAEKPPTAPVTRPIFRISPFAMSKAVRMPPFFMT